jgi:hypothetical protein
VAILRIVFLLDAKEIAMFGIDWTNLEVYHWLALGGGGLAVLALIVYFVAPSGFKLPAGLISTIAALVAGVGVGVIGMAAFGYRTQKYEPGEITISPEEAEKIANAKGPPPGKGPPQGMPGFGGMPPFGGGGKGKGPNPKNQLTALVTKLDQLTEKPLSLKLSTEQRTAIGNQLKDLADQDELSDDDAKTRLEAILDAVKDDRKTLEAAGYNWPGGGGGGPPGGFMAPPGPSNPFKDAKNRQRLDSLQKRIGKK